MTQKHLWYSYDFANSFMGIVLIFYFPLILIERGGQELWIGISSSVATAGMLLLLPRVGHYVDMTGKARMVLLTCTLLSASTLAVLALFFSLDTTTKTSSPVLPLVLFGVFYLFYESAITVYSGMMRRVGDQETLPRTSGFGYAFGQLGNVACLLLTKVVIGSGVIIYVIADKPLALLFGGVLGFVLTLPYILTLPRRIPVGTEQITFSYQRIWSVVRSDDRLRAFLIATLLIYDTILTLQLYITSYLKTVFNFSESLVLYAGVTALFFGVVGAVLGGYVATKFSTPTKVLALSAALYTICAFLFAFSPADEVFVIGLLALCGISYGLVFSLGRTVYAVIVPASSQHEYFGIYTVFERMAAVVGPLLWTCTFLAFSSYGEVVQYRVSVFSLAVIALIAGVLFINFHRKFESTVSSRTPQISQNTTVF